MLGGQFVLFAESTRGGMVALPITVCRYGTTGTGSEAGMIVVCANVHGHWSGGGSCGNRVTRNNGLSVIQPQCLVGTDSHVTHRVGGVCCSDGAPTRYRGSAIW